MSKILEILKNYDTEEKIQYLDLISSPPTGDVIRDLMKKAHIKILHEKILKQAKIVLSGGCPHERPVVGREIFKVEPRDWIYWYEEANVYGKCKFCGV